MCLLIACVLLLALLDGCATPTQPDVGAVVIAPRVSLPAPPVIVQTTTPKAVGYFQGSLLGYFGGSRERPTILMPPMLPAGQMLTP